MLRCLSFVPFSLVPTLCVGMPGRDALRRLLNQRLIAVDAERLGRAFPRGAWERVQNAAVVMGLMATSLIAGPPVAETDPLTPAEQIKKFHLPPGFEIQLVASEPDIQKPMNLAFDARGRLWVSHSIEYPWAVPEGMPARDGITILDGIGADGRATKITKFAEDLNIPIGVLPMPNGKDVIAWSIPYIWKLTDSDSDGKVDQREILYGPFDYVDTHGNQNAFRLGPDGWVYACHGFRNASKVKLKGQGPVVLEMTSGNTYRFRPDGSAIEQISWGQVNPFGMCFDARGDMFTADCHSKPITMILRGSYHDSFGKPHDGLGFAPIMTSNDHGSTGISGVAVYEADHFPAEYRGNLFVCNVVTNRIHRDVIQWRGSSPWIEKPQDFLVCDDWWHHPVDMQLGPDGALYIADFYNSIIGHYEVDLKHPRRDRHRGRIWRVVYTGTDKKQAAPTPPNLHTTKLNQLIDSLGSLNIATRNLARNEYLLRDIIPGFGSGFQANAVTAIIGSASSESASECVQAMWILEQQGGLPDSISIRLAKHPSDFVRVHLARILGERKAWAMPIAGIVSNALNDDSPFVRRAAVEALGRHPDAANVQPLAAMLITTDRDDVQLIHATKIALRNQLRSPAILDQLATVKLVPSELEKVAEIARAVPNEAAAWFTFDYLRQHTVAPEVAEASLTHVARFVSPQRMDEVAEFVQQQYPQDVFRQAAMFQSIFAGLTQRGQKLEANTKVGQWGAALAKTLLDPQRKSAPAWENFLLPGAGASASPWGVKPRGSTDGDKDALYFDSIANGETLTGVLRSAPFALPEKFTFWMCGHNGQPGTNPPPVNHARLVLVDSGEVIRKQEPPRNDVAREYTWDTKPWAGQQAVFEAVDADTGTAYAWLAVGRFSPPVVAAPVAGAAFADSTAILAVQIAEQLDLTDLATAVLDRLKNRHAEAPVRIAASSAGLKLARNDAIQTLVGIVQDPEEPNALRTVAAQRLGALNNPVTRDALSAALVTAPGALQQPFALALAGSPQGSELLFAMIANGKVSARLLQDQPVLERLRQVNIADRDQRIEQLTSGLPAADDRLKQTIARIGGGFTATDNAPAAGMAVFKKSCVACHRIQNEGGKVGPQLDGVGIRGIERLLEDILDPNRNVDGAFRATVIVTKDGVTVTGLKLREEGGAVILGDAQGKEVRVVMTDIDEQRQTNLSPMPSNFAEQLKEDDLRALLSYLLQQRQAVAAP